MTRAALAVAVLALALCAGPAHATWGWYDPNGSVHLADDPGDVCYDHGGVEATDAAQGAPVDGIPTWDLIVTCRDGTIFVVSGGEGIAPGLIEAIFAFAYVDPQPAAPPQGDEPWEELGISECEYWAMMAGRHG